MKETLVVVGNGMAAMRTVEELLRLAPDKYDITVFGEEPHGNYNRILLSPLLSGEKTLDDIMLNDLNWYEKNSITLYAGSGKRVSTIDRLRRRVVSEDGTEASYHRLLIATGSKPFIIPVPGKDLAGVITFRDISDVDTMLDAARHQRHAVVIGGGLLGLEAANGLMKRGMKVTVVHDVDSLMNRQLDNQAAALLKNELEQKGISFRMGAKTTHLEGNQYNQVTHIHFASGERLPAEIVVMAAGIRPNTELAEKSGLYCEKGIVVNDTMQSYDPYIYAIGECVQHRGQIFGLVAPIWDQARVCANHLAGFGIDMYKSKVLSTQLKVTGVALFSAGDFTGDGDSENIIFKDPGRGIYKKLVLKDNKVIGSVLYGDTGDSAWYFHLMKAQEDISGIRDALIFGQRNAAVN